VSSFEAHDTQQRFAFQVGGQRELVRLKARVQARARCSIGKNFGDKHCWLPRSNN
jgi:hypothetical protein